MINYSINISGSDVAQVLPNKLINVINVGTTSYEVDFPSTGSLIGKKYYGTLVSDTGLFKEDIKYIFPSNTENLQGTTLAMDYDPIYNNIYGTTFYGYYVYNLATEETKHIKIENGGGFTDIALGQNKIYINDEFNDSIHVYAKLDNEKLSTITGFNVPRKLLLDEANNKLYVSSSQEFKVKIINLNNYKVTGTIQFLTNEWPENITILNNKLYVVTNTTLDYRDIVVISGINNINTQYNAFGNNTGYKRLQTLQPYSILGVPKNNNVYISSSYGLQILDSTNDTFNGFISGFAENIQNLPYASQNSIPAFDMIFNESDNRIYSISRAQSVVFVSNTGTRLCEKIIDLSYITNSPQSLVSYNNKIYINASDNLSPYRNGHFFIELGNRPKSTITFPSIPVKDTLSGSFNLNVTSSNLSQSIIYKSSRPDVASINNTGDVTILGSGVVTIFAGQVDTGNFALSINSKSLTVLAAIPLAPNTPTSTNVLNTSFTANWNSIVGATSYRLDVSTGSPPFTTNLVGYDNLTVNGTSQSITGLTAGTTYHARVRASNSIGASDNSLALIQSTVPLAPTLQASTNVTQSGFIANWNSVNGATSYRLDVSTSVDPFTLGPNFITNLVGYNNLVVNSTSQSVTGLSMNTSYYFRVRAVNSQNISTNSLTGTLKTYLLQAPYAYAEVTLPAQNTNAAVEMRFILNTGNGERVATADDQITGYYCFAVKNINEATATAQDINDFVCEMITPTGLRCNLPMSSCNYTGSQVFYPWPGFGTNTTSQLVNNPTFFQQPVVSPAPPPNQEYFFTIYQITGIRSDKLNINSSGRYLLKRGGSQNNFYVNELTLDSGVPYVFAPSHIELGTSEQRIAELSSTWPPCRPATNVSFFNVTTTGFTVGWDESIIYLPEALIDISTNSGFNSFVRHYSGVNAINSFIETGLEPSTAYWARVRSKNWVLTTSPFISNERFTGPRAPIAPIISNVTRSGFRASWDRIPRARLYTARVATDPNFTNTILNTGFFDSEYFAFNSGVNITGLLPSTIYYTRIRVQDIAFYENISNTSITTTLNI